MVCECHSITQAAKKFFVTQPAVTAAIRELEKEYAVRLVDKEGKSIRLTKAGKDFTNMRPRCWITRRNSMTRYIIW